MKTGSLDTTTASRSALDSSLLFKLSKVHDNFLKHSLHRSTSPVKIAH